MVEVSNKMGIEINCAIQMTTFLMQRWKKSDKREVFNFILLVVLYKDTKDYDSSLGNERDTEYESVSCQSKSVGFL